MRTRGHVSKYVTWASSHLPNLSPPHPKIYVRNTGSASGLFSLILEFPIRIITYFTKSNLGGHTCLDRITLKLSMKGIAARKAFKIVATVCPSLRNFPNPYRPGTSKVFIISKRHRPYLPSGCKDNINTYQRLMRLLLYLTIPHTAARVSFLDFDLNARVISWLK